jgi:putative tricarboxylic transport membrane protein
MTIMWSNWLVGSITTLAVIMLFWPLISKGLKTIIPAKPDKISEERPVE